MIPRRCPASLPRPFSSRRLTTYPYVQSLERAFQLAASGRFEAVAQIKQVLHYEGYQQQIVEGPSFTSSSPA